MPGLRYTNEPIEGGRPVPPMSPFNKMNLHSRALCSPCNGGTVPDFRADSILADKNDARIIGVANYRSFSSPIVKLTRSRRDFLWASASQFLGQTRVPVARYLYWTTNYSNTEDLEIKTTQERFWDLRSKLTPGRFGETVWRNRGTLKDLEVKLIIQLLPLLRIGLRSEHWNFVAILRR